MSDNLDSNSIIIKVDASISLEVNKDNSAADGKTVEHGHRFSWITEGTLFQALFLVLKLQKVMLYSSLMVRKSKHQCKPFYGCDG